MTQRRFDKHIAVPRPAGHIEGGTGSDRIMAGKENARLHRQFDRLSRRVPFSAGFLGWIRRPSSRFVRFPLGILLILGGIFSFLPVLGIWMLPLGLLLLALDLPFLQGPLNSLSLRIQRRWTNWRRRRKAKRD